MTDLLQQHRKVQDSNGKSGNKINYCIYMPDIDDISGNWAELRPNITGSTREAKNATPMLHSSEETTLNDPGPSTKAATNKRQLDRLHHKRGQSGKRHKKIKKR